MRRRRINILDTGSLAMFGLLSKSLTYKIESARIIQTSDFGELVYLHVRKDEWMKWRVRRFTLLALQEAERSGCERAGKIITELARKRLVKSVKNVRSSIHH